jgi:hypothetical protein
MLLVRVDRVQTVRSTSGTWISLRNSRTSRSLLTKASIAWAYLDVLFTLNHLLILDVSNFDHRKDFIVFDDILLDSYGLIKHG